MLQIWLQNILIASQKHDRRYKDFQEISVKLKVEQEKCKITEILNFLSEEPWSFSCCIKSIENAGEVL